MIELVLGALVLLLAAGCCFAGILSCARLHYLKKEQLRLVNDVYKQNESLSIKLGRLTSEQQCIVFELKSRGFNL